MENLAEENSHTVFKNDTLCASIFSLMSKGATAYISHVLDCIPYNQFTHSITQEVNHIRSTMDPEKQQKRELDQPGSPTPDPAAPQTEHTERLHDEAPGEDNDTIEPKPSEDCSNKVHTPTKSTAAETFINIPELRLMLYKTMADSATSTVSEFSSLFLSSKEIYSEAQIEIVRSRKKYTDAEESKWSEIWGLPVTISKPHCFRDLNNVTVTVPVNCHMPYSKNLYGYRGLWGFGRRNPEWPLRDVALTRLELILSLPEGHPVDNDDWQQIIEVRRATWGLISSSQLSPDSSFRSQCVTETPLRAQCFVFIWRRSQPLPYSVIAAGFEGLRGWDARYMTGQLGWIVKRNFTWTGISREPIERSRLELIGTTRQHLG